MLLLLWVRSQRLPHRLDWLKNRTASLVCVFFLSFLTLRQSGFPHLGLSYLPLLLFCSGSVELLSKNCVSLLLWKYGRRCYVLKSCRWFSSLLLRARAWSLTSGDFPSLFFLFTKKERKKKKNKYFGANFIYLIESLTSHWSKFKQSSFQGSFSKVFGEGDPNLSKSNRIHFNLKGWAQTKAQSPKRLR